MIKIACLLEKKDGVVAWRFHDTGHICVMDAETVQQYKTHEIGEVVGEWILDSVNT